MQDTSILITALDMGRLRRLSGRELSSSDFCRFLDRAKVIPPETAPRDLVTMNTRVRILESAPGETSVWRVVYPENEDLRHGRISVIRPFGMALLGRKVGDKVEWNIPGKRSPVTSRILEIVYQPESFGHLTL